MVNLLVCLVVIVVAGLSAELVRAGFRRRLSTPVTATRPAPVPTAGSEVVTGD